MIYAQIIDEKNQALTRGEMMMQGYGKPKLKGVQATKTISYEMGNRGNYHVKPTGENKAIDFINNKPVGTTKSRIEGLRG